MAVRPPAVAPKLPDIGPGPSDESGGRLLPPVVMPKPPNGQTRVPPRRPPPPKFGGVGGPLKVMHFLSIAHGLCLRLVLSVSYSKVI